MKKTIFTVLFIFSVAINLAVAATVLWYMWNNGPSATPQEVQGAQLTRDDVRLIDNLWPQNKRASLRENREKIRQKKLELLDFIARHPGDLKAIQQKLDELALLRAQEAGAHANQRNSGRTAPRETRRVSPIPSDPSMHGPWNGPGNGPRYVPYAGTRRNGRHGWRPRYAAAHGPERMMHRSDSTHMKAHWWSP